ncbi:MAG: ribosomal protein S18-alanine N-acetyltransferase [Nitrososphaerales archaeon]
MVRRCGDQDLDQVLAIERVCFKHPYDYLTFFYFLTKEPEGFYVAEENGHILGYAIFSSKDDKGNVISIAVLPEFRRRGIGSKLLEEGLEFLSKKVKEVELQVRVGNREAINFYRRFGFREKCLIYNYYPDGEDALVMLKRVA